MYHDGQGWIEHHVDASVRTKTNASKHLDRTDQNLHIWVRLVFSDSHATHKAHSGTRGVCKFTLHQ